MELSSAAQIQDQYLTLLVSQLQNQDPLEPVSQEDFLGQVAQMSTLSGIEKLNSSFESMVSVQSDLLKLQEVAVGSDLVGKSVEYTNPASFAVESGTIDSYRVSDGRVLLQVGDVELTVDHLIAIRQ